MRESDLDFCDELRASVGWNQRRADWAAFLRLAPEGCFIAVLEGRAAGTITTIAYGQTIGWIGMLIVHPTCRKSGVGTRLLEHAIACLKSRGVGTIKLDATPQGEPLYARLGFRSEGRITRWAADGPRSPPSNPGPKIREFQARDFDDVLRADERAFGAAREPLFRAVHNEALAIRMRKAEDASEFAMLRPGATAKYLGPIVAHDIESARELVLAVTAGAAAQRIIWDLPERSGRELLAKELGFKPQRTLARMSLGPKVEGAMENYWGLVDPACG